MKHLFKNSRKAGFALVVTLALMILLTVIAVGLLSLSSISLRAAVQGEAANTARNNARMAMMVALGELQASLGPDQRVSATASSVIANPAQPRLTGAWESWRWTPVANDKPNYSEKAAKFRRWLISTANDADAKNFDFATKQLPSGIDSVPLVGALMDSQNVSTEVTATKVPISRNGKISGKYAWAVFDESVKAPIHLENTTPAITATVEAASRTAPNRVRADVVAPALTGLVSPKNIISLDTGVIPSGPGTVSEMRRRFHDFTTSTVGLLSDTSKGGLKTDLTSLFEDENATLPGIGPDYPLYFTSADGVPTWPYLRDHYRKYKSLTSGNTGNPTYKPLATSDLAINNTGIDPTPKSERLLPVIAKCQIVFSMVAHHTHEQYMKDYYDAKGGGYLKYAIPYLVYEPVFTLHNPYDVALKLDRMRIRVWDPPIKFRFEKINKQPTPTESGVAPFRLGGPGFNDPAAFYTLGQLQGGTEGYLGTGQLVHMLPYARRAFTFILSDGDHAASGAELSLLPGEVKVFSARVEDSWTWGMETSSANRPFNDFLADKSANLGNVDKRSLDGIGAFGVEAVPGWDTRAGLQTYHLSGAYVREGAKNFYDFERSIPPAPRIIPDALVMMRLTDDVRVVAKPEAPVDQSNQNLPFVIEVLAGKKTGNLDYRVENMNADEDLVRRFKFTFSSDIVKELFGDASLTKIQRVFRIQDILQTPTDNPGLKTPFAILEVSARTTKDPLTDSKPWLFNNHLVDGAQQNHVNVGPSHQSYDIRFREMSNSFNSFPGIEVDPDTERGFFGADSSQAEGGSSFIIRAKVPVAPMASLGELISTNVVASSRLPRVVNPFGNARAHPLLRTDRINRNLTGVGNILDQSYLLNDVLWDSYYFSTVTDYQEGVFTESSDARNRLSVLNGIFNGTQPPLNSRITCIQGASQTVVQQIDGFSAKERAKKLANYIGVSGAFNLNSTSVDAWQAVLFSLRDRTVTGWKNTNQANLDRTPFPRATLPVAGAAEGMADPSSVIGNNVRWAGYRSLDDAKIKRLAEEIVKEITSRSVQDKAPALTVGEFVNRRLASDDSGDLQSGILQAAIDASGVNAINQTMDSRVISYTSSKRNAGTANTTAMNGFSGDGSPSSLTQGDLMTALAPIVTVRGDTFKIRCYGEALAADQSTVLARAWCETVVQRVPSFVESINQPEADISNLSNTNKTYGRRFEIVSFRWLTREEL